MIVKDEKQLDDALQEAFQYGDHVLCEAFFTGKEVAAGVMMGEDGRAVPMPLVLIEPHVNFYDFHNKYTKGATTYTCPAPFDAETTRRLQKIAVAAYEALGCSGVARTDLMLADNGDCIALEVNTIPDDRPPAIPTPLPPIGLLLPGSRCRKIEDGH